MEHSLIGKWKYHNNKHKMDLINFGWYQQLTKESVKVAMILHKLYILFIMGYWESKIVDFLSIQNLYPLSLHIILFTGSKKKILNDLNYEWGHFKS